MQVEVVGDKTIVKLGMPADLYLQQFGSLIEDVFGEVPYHVGSSVEGKKTWRDDV